MSVLSTFVTLFAIIGLLTLVGLLLYLVSKAIKTKTLPAKIQGPPEDYMNKIGLRCPSGWDFIEERKIGNNMFDVCQNSFNVPVNGNKCYDNPYLKQKYFPKISWKDWNKQNIPNTERCKWVRNCGPIINGSKSDASWIGITPKC